MKKLKIFLISLVLPVLLLSSCQLQGIGSNQSSLLFDENGNMLCDYYLINIYVNSRQENPDGGFYYALHKYREVGGREGKDLVSYRGSAPYNVDATAIYTSYGPNDKDVYFPYAVPKCYAEAEEILPVKELKNCSGSEYEEKRSFCAEVTAVGEDRITVKPLEGCAEVYIFDTLSVSSKTSGLGITADELSAGDIIRIFYNAGLWKYGINIRGTDHFELIMTEKNGIEFGFVGLQSYSEPHSFENTVNFPTVADGSISGELPVYVINSAAELASQYDILKDEYYSNFPSLNFNFLTDNYTDGYFENNALILTYLPSPSISYKYEIKELDISNEKLMLEISRTNDPKTPYPQTMLYAVFIEADKETARSLQSFDAVLSTKKEG